MAVLGFVITWGQLLTRPDGLLRTVGRISLNELYALECFKALGKNTVRTRGPEPIVIGNKPWVVAARRDSFPAQDHRVVDIDFGWGSGLSSI